MNLEQIMILFGHNYLHFSKTDKYHSLFIYTLYTTEFCIGMEITFEASESTVVAEMKLIDIITHHHVKKLVLINQQDKKVEIDIKK